jgi:hypothetical protein
MDLREFPTVGLVNEVPFILVSFLEMNYCKSLIFVDILAQCGMLLSRKCEA